MVTLLEKSGHRYTKVSDGIWEINFTGDNLKDFSVRLALGDNILVTMAKLAFDSNRIVSLIDFNMQCNSKCSASHSMTMQMR